jgi:hypothetical protein
MRDGGYRSDSHMFHVSSDDGWCLGPYLLGLDGCRGVPRVIANVVDRKWSRRAYSEVES